MNSDKTKDAWQNNYRGFLFDLIIYISVMFLVREIYIPKVGFIANGLFWSFTTLVVATWRMKVRNVTWKGAAAAGLGERARAAGRRRSQAGNIETHARSARPRG